MSRRVSLGCTGAMNAAFGRRPADLRAVDLRAVDLRAVFLAVLAI